jgi:hypothetical protein
MPKQPTPADFDGDVWRELGCKWVAFVEEMQDEGKGGAR